MSQPDLSVIIASYNTAEITAACVRSVLDDERRHRGRGASWSTTHRATTRSERLRDEFPDITRAGQPESNVHYAKTNNRGLRECPGRYAMLLNSDTIVRPERAGHPGRATWTTIPRSAACGPKLVNPDGSVQYCIRSFPGVGGDVLPGAQPAQALAEQPDHQPLLPPRPRLRRGPHRRQPRHDGVRHSSVRLGGRTACSTSGSRSRSSISRTAPCWALAGERIDYVGEAVVVHLGSQSINLNSASEVGKRAHGLRVLYDEYLAERDPVWKRPIVRAGIAAWGVLRSASSTGCRRTSG